MKKSAGNKYSVAMVEPLGKGGWAQYTYCLLSTLASRIGEVTLLTASNTRFLGMNLPYAVKPILFSAANRLISRLKLQKRRRVRRLLKAIEVPLNHLRILHYCRINRPDIIHFQTAYSFEGLLIPLYRHLGIKVVYTAHDILHQPTYPGDRIIYRHLYRAVDAIIVNGLNLKNELLDLFPEVAPEKITISILGNDQELEDLPKFTCREARRSISLPPEDKVVLFYGIIREYKGLEVLIRAFARLLENLPDCRLIIAGEPIGDFSPYQFLIDRLAIADRVGLFLHFIPLSRTPAFFAAADVVALPYLEASQTGIVPIAYSYGRPVVVSRVGGLPECVIEGKSGYIFPPGDARALADRLYNVLSDRERNTRMKKFAARYYRDNFSWDKIAGDTMAVYHRVLTQTDTGQSA